MPQDNATITLRGFPLGEASRGVQVATKFLIEHSGAGVGSYHGVTYGADVMPWRAEMWVYRTKTGVVVRWIAE